MSTFSRRPARPRLIIPSRKSVEYSTRPLQHVAIGNLSPNLLPATPPASLPAEKQVLCIGKYLLLEAVDLNVYKAWHAETMEEYICKVFPLSTYRERLSPYFRLDSHDNVVDIKEIICGETNAYAIFSKQFGDLHSYVKSKLRLREDESRELFAQITAAVAHCHANGVVVRDLKLRKFVFADAQRTWLKLDGLENGACVLESGEAGDDTLVDTPYACPPGYISPEIAAMAGRVPGLSMTFAVPVAPAALTTRGSSGYSGKAADMWSLGVVLYSMLTGRYPFQEADAKRQIHRICTGIFTVPECLTYNARCLIRSLLRRDATQRLEAADVAYHPWLLRRQADADGSCSSHVAVRNSSAAARAAGDQRVPSIEAPTPTKGRKVVAGEDDGAGATHQDLTA